jgi:hypothetical protein
MSTLKELINKAISDIDLYKHPDIDEAKARLDELLVAAGLGTIKGDYLSDLDMYNNKLHIRTEWSARGCANHSDYELPISILEAEDPIKAATVWGLQQKIDQETAQIRTYQAYVDSATTRVIDLLQRLGEVQ